MSHYVAKRRTVIGKVPYSVGEEIPSGALLPDNVLQMVARGAITVHDADKLPAPKGGKPGDVLVVGPNGDKWVPGNSQSGADSELTQELKDKMLYMQTELEAVDATLSSKIYDLLVRLEEAETEALDAQSDIDRIKPVIDRSGDWNKATDKHSYNVGDQASLNGKVYVVTRAVNGSAPDVDTGAWALVGPTEPTIPNWKSETAYNVGDETVFNRKLYVCDVNVKAGQSPPESNEEKWTLVGESASGASIVVSRNRPAMVEGRVWLEVA